MLFFLHTINDVVFFLTFTRRVKILKLAKFSFFFFLNIKFDIIKKLTVSRRKW